ncbi:MAG: sigma-70 family RNA polymerase sigma factor [Actinomycetota bacterium]
MTTPARASRRHTEQHRRCRTDRTVDPTVALGRRLAAGDRTVVRDLYRQYGGRVLAVALRASGDRTLAEDAVQETFLRLWRSASSFDPERELDRWVLRIARNTAYDLGRAKVSRPQSSHLDPEPVLLRQVDGRRDGQPEEMAAALGSAWELRAAIDALPSVEREVVRRQHLDGLTHREIAEELGVSVGTVKSRSHRAHRRLAAAVRVSRAS